MATAAPPRRPPLASLWRASLRHKEGDLRHQLRTSAGALTGLRLHINAKHTTEYETRHGEAVTVSVSPSSCFITSYARDFKFFSQHVTVYYSTI